MEIKYQIFEKEGLLIQKFRGPFAIDYYFKYTGFLMSIPEMRSINKVLIDFRDVDFEIIPLDFGEGLERMTEMRKNIQNKEIKRDDVMIVFWVDKPIPTVIAQIYKEKFSNYYYCSTTRHIIDTMEIPPHLHDLDTLTQNLEKSF